MPPMSVPAGTDSVERSCSTLSAMPASTSSSVVLTAPPFTHWTRAPKFSPATPPT